MGTKSAEEIELSCDDLRSYLYANHSVYMDYEGKSYYLTDVNENYWRAQDTMQFNEKGHYVDASDLVSTVGEFFTLPFLEGKSLADVCDQAVFYASVKE